MIYLNLFPGGNLIVNTREIIVNARDARDARNARSSRNSLEKGYCETQ